MLELKQKYDGDEFHVVARTNALRKLVTEEESYSTCLSTPSLWFYVSGNGDVYACGAHVGNPNFLLGNIYEDAIESIWKSDDRRSCLTFVKEELDLAVCRNNCRMDEANRYLDQLVEAPVLLKKNRDIGELVETPVLHKSFI